MTPLKPTKLELFGELSRLAAHYAKLPKTAIMFNSIAAQIANAPEPATQRILASAWYLHNSILYGSVDIMRVALEHKGPSLHSLPTSTNTPFCPGMGMRIPRVLTVVWKDSGSPLLGSSTCASYANERASCAEGPGSS
jgi:hypothetical protein